MHNAALKLEAANPAKITEWQTVDAGCTAAKALAHQWEIKTPLSMGVSPEMASRSKEK